MDFLRSHGIHPGMQYFESLLKQYEAILVGRWITDLANTSAFLFSELPDLNWVGFYLLEGDNLALGPFQGKPACTDIRLGRGVCGKAALEQKTIVVHDVHEFPDHIACDAASRSEVVVPLIRQGKLLGVLDVDAPIVGRFTDKEARFFEDVVKTLLQKNI